MASSNYPISPILSAAPLNSNVGFNNSWIQVDSPYRPTYAQLTYAVNLDDNLAKLDYIANIVSSSIGTYTNLLIALTSAINGINQTQTVDYSSYFNSLTSHSAIIENNTFVLNQIVNGLTGIQVDKQDQLIALSQTLTSISNRIDSNTDHVENLITATNDNLSVIMGWDYSTSTNQQDLNNIAQSINNVLIDTQNKIISLNQSLTSIQAYKQDQLISLGQSLTSIQVDKQDQLIALGQSINDSNQKIAGFSIPPHDQIDITYISTTNNIDTITYSNSSVVVLSLIMTYDPHPPTVDDARIKRVKKG